MFAQNIGYQWSFVDDVAVDAGVFAPAGQVMPFALKRDHPENLREILFDPQLYVCDFKLNWEEYEKLLMRFASYPWFGCDCRHFQSSADGNVTKWKRELRDNLPSVWSDRWEPTKRWDQCVIDCVDFQVAFGCSRIILPATLLRDPEDPLDSFMARLDDAVMLATDVTNLPLLASLPIDEDAIRHHDFRTNDFIESIVDQVSARPELNGVYLPITRRGGTKRIRERNVAGAILRFAHLLGQKLGLYVVVNYADMLGVAAVAVGASAFGAGSSYTQNRFVVTDHRKSGGGFALPKFRSLELGVDLVAEKDLPRLADGNFLRYIKPDETEYSSALFDALQNGAPITDVAAWVGQNNLTEAQKHCAEVMSRHSQRHSSSPDAALQWLQDAEARYSYLKQRFSKEPLDDDGMHLTPWRAALEGLLSST